MGTATVAADGKQEAQVLVEEQPAAQLRLDAPMLSVPPVYAACCGRCELPS